jgi:hypothetical protein
MLTYQLLLHSWHWNTWENNLKEEGFVGFSSWLFVPMHSDRTYGGRSMWQRRFFTSWWTERGRAFMVQSSLGTASQACPEVCFTNFLGVSPSNQVDNETEPSQVYPCQMKCKHFLFSFLFIYSYVHALFGPFLPPYPSASTSPHFQAEFVLPLSLISMKRKYKQQ